MSGDAQCSGILVVDDDPDIRDSLREVLEDEGYGTSCVANGREALDFLRSGKRPCVILLDLMMPVMDGWQFLEEQKRDPALAAIPVLNEMSHLPVILDPSHATGKRSLVPALSRAAVAIGADGLLVEVHPAPEKAVSDGAQSLDLPQFRKMMQDLRPYVDLWKASRVTQATAAV